MRAFALVVVAAIVLLIVVVTRGLTRERARYHEAIAAARSRVAALASEAD